MTRLDLNFDYLDKLGDVELKHLCDEFYIMCPHNKDDMVSNLCRFDYENQKYPDLGIIIDGVPLHIASPKKITRMLSMYGIHTSKYKPIVLQELLGELYHAIMTTHGFTPVNRFLIDCCAAKERRYALSQHSHFKFIGLRFKKVRHILERTPYPITPANVMELKKYKGIGDTTIEELSSILLQSNH